MANKPNILYIEDEPGMLELTRQALKISGYSLTMATSGQQGMSMIRQQKPDVLLLDLMMADFNGWDIYRQLKSDEELASIPVIVITAKHPTQNPHVIIDDLPPVEAYLTKPVEIDHLLQSVQSYL